MDGSFGMKLLFRKTTPQLEPWDFQPNPSLWKEEMELIIGCANNMKPLLKSLKHTVGRALCLSRHMHAQG